MPAIGLSLPFLLAVGAWAQTGRGPLPRFEDYQASNIFAGTPASPNFNTKLARLYRTRIRDGVEKGWGVERDGNQQGAPGPNFAGKMIIVQWSTGAPGMAMAMVDAETGKIYFPPISFRGLGVAGFDLPLLSVGLAVPQNPRVEFRLNSRLMVIKATPNQTGQQRSYTYYFLWQDDRWTLLKRIPLTRD